LRFRGWRFEGDIPDVPKFVAIIAPHTSNWDFFIMLQFAIAKKVSARWLGKHTIFRWPLVSLLQSLGGIPLDRRKRSDVVASAVTAFEENDQLILAMAPEGTRKFTHAWKSGFYHIAREAAVPVLLVYLDYEKRVAGTGPLITLTGNVDEDMASVEEFYQKVTAKYPVKTSTIRINA
jgi:1-acyl-sn-glycerol-3-phosphate acyltransferase